MNPGLIPPADVAAAAKKGWSCARKFTGACGAASPAADSLTARLNKRAAE
jgi:hypothetical protein